MKITIECNNFDALLQSMIGFLKSHGFAVSRSRGAETIHALCQRLKIHYSHFRRTIDEPNCPQVDIDWCRGGKRPRFIYATPEFDAYLTRYRNNQQKEP